MNPCIMGQLCCRCCGKGEPAEELIHALRRLSILAACTIWVNSCYRCEKHNLAVGGSPRSQHLTGSAADVWAKALPPDQLALAAEEIEEFRNGGIGYYHDKRFVHLDVRGVRARWGQVAGKTVSYQDALKEAQRG
jgi:uncharacterized protein YcbK (DUF882 family)